MERLLLRNLARTQAFDAAMQNGRAVDAAAGELLGEILQPKTKRRQTAIEKLKGRIERYYAAAAQPQARTLGRELAESVLEKLPKDLRRRTLDSARLRQRILVDMELRPAQRLQIVRHHLADRANTLENRLAMFWLEPGADEQTKLGRLLDLHRDMDARQKAYHKALAEFHAGRGPRPRRPQLDYLAEFAHEAKQGLRQQARRAGTDAETATFVRAGHTTLAWVTVNASEACKDCRERQGLVKSVQEWDGFGRPGSGATVCGVNCFCMLVPADTIRFSPALQRGLEVPKPTGGSS